MDATLRKHLDKIKPQHTLAVLDELVSGVLLSHGDGNTSHGEAIEYVVTKHECEKQKRSDERKANG